MVNKPKDKEPAAAAAAAEEEAAEEEAAAKGELSKDDIAANIAKLKNGGKPGGFKGKKKSVKADTPEGEEKKGKEKRSWDDSGDNSKPLKGKSQLDFSKKDEGGSSARVVRRPPSITGRRLARERAPAPGHHTRPKRGSSRQRASSTSTPSLATGRTTTTSCSRRRRRTASTQRRRWSRPPRAAPRRRRRAG